MDGESGGMVRQGRQGAARHFLGDVIGVIGYWEGEGFLTDAVRIVKVVMLGTVGEQLPRQD
jgi:hypothetical protein